MHCDVCFVDALRPFDHFVEYLTSFIVNIKIIVSMPQGGFPRNSVMRGSRKFSQGGGAWGPNSQKGFDRKFQRDILIIRAQLFKTNDVVS